MSHFGKIKPKPVNLKEALETLIKELCPEDLHEIKNGNPVWLHHGMASLTRRTRNV